MVTDVVGSMESPPVNVYWVQSLLAKNALVCMRFSCFSSDMLRFRSKYDKLSASNNNNNNDKLLTLIF